MWFRLFREKSGIVYDIQKDVFAQTVAVRTVRCESWREDDILPYDVGWIGQIIIAVGTQQPSRIRTVCTLHV